MNEELNNWEPVDVIQPSNKVFYKCDPELHTNCPKTNCFINGGGCKETLQVKFAKQPLDKVRMVVPMSQEEFDELTREPTRAERRAKIYGNSKL